LAIALPNKSHHLQETAQIYQKLVTSDLLWKIWWIDEYGKLWVKINFLSDNQQPQFHTIAIDEDINRENRKCKIRLNCG